MRKIGSAMGQVTQRILGELAGGVDGVAFYRITYDDQALSRHEDLPASALESVPGLKGDNTVRVTRGRGFDASRLNWRLVRDEAES